jgi:hypothetical protein
MKKTDAAARAPGPEIKTINEKSQKQKGLSMIA